jgi:DNA polymerase IV
VKAAPLRKRILHVDLEPFFVSVERSLDPALRDRPVIVGGDAGSNGVVAAASAEAQAAGVRPGLPLARARQLCPDAVFRPGDFEAYARVSEEVTSILLAASRRVERPSADEAYVDLTPETAASPSPVLAAEAIKDQIQRRLGLDAALGLASCRLGARVASAGARPRGLLLVLPGYEASFVARQPIDLLPDLSATLEVALRRGGFETLGQVAAAEPGALASAVGAVAAVRLQDSVLGRHEEPIPVTAPPTWVQQEATIRDPRSDRAALESILEDLASLAFGRLRPFQLEAGTLTVEVHRPGASQRASETVEPGIADEATARAVTRTLGRPLLAPARTVRLLQVRLSRLAPASAQAPLFPELFGMAQPRTG